jgi:hypothetical protein
LHHSYDARGSYTASVTVAANCTPDRATATAAVTVAA